MNERRIVTNHNFGGTLAANQIAVDEFPFRVTYLGSKACATNDSSATLALSGGVTVTGTAIGDSSDPVYIQPTAPTAVAANTAITFTLDYDGSAGTAAQNVNIINFYLSGE